MRNHIPTKCESIFCAEMTKAKKNKNSMTSYNC